LTLELSHWSDRGAGSSHLVGMLQKFELEECATCTIVTCPEAINAIKRYSEEQEGPFPATLEDHEEYMRDKVGLWEIERLRFQWSSKAKPLEHTARQPTR
jgi:hypothetical protein